MIAAMFSVPAGRALATCCLLLAACTGTHARGPGSPTAISSPDAPAWARAGDQKSADGSLFVCEGSGADEQQAVDAARALCSAKICELCGVEVKSTVETRETLQQVEVERKVVETCRRVRKSDEEIRYRQAGCGPGGCSAYLQVYFSAESEARECRAYAEGNYADSAQCEQLIEQFRSTPGLSAESFRVRAALLDQAIVACAEIDVRPTPKLTALDEILWQGVLSPQAEEPAPRPLDKARPIAERLRVLAQNQADARNVEHARHAYRAIDRQPLRESKVFVDRIALIRDAMLGYSTIMAALEALVDAEQWPGEQHDAALVRALRGLRPVASVYTTERILAWAADEISRERAALQQPAIKAYFMEQYASAPDAVGYALMRALTSDRRADSQEWKFVRGQMASCFRCAASLLDQPEHGGDAVRMARLLELAPSASSESDIGTLADLSPEFLLRAEDRLPADVRARLFSYAWARRWLTRMPTAGREHITQIVHDTYAQRDDWHWTVSPPEHLALVSRALGLLEASAGSLRCEELGKELDLLETHGADTRSLEPSLCRCVAEPRRDGMRGLTELYRRLVAWSASCVKEGP